MSFKATLALSIVGIAAVVTRGSTGIVIQAQTPTAETRPSFAVASVKPNKSGATATSIGFQEQSGRFRAVNEPLWRLIAEAYRSSFQLRRFEVIGVPDRMAGDRFDVEAVPEGNPSPDQRKVMLQNLLADRFKLVLHHETRELPTYNLVKAGADGKLGEQLHPSKIDCAAIRAGSSLPPTPEPGQDRPCVMMFGQSLLRADGLTIDALATAQLSRYVDRKVIDQTNLQGPFQWSLEWASDSAPADLGGVSIFTALQEQLGLKLESTRGPVEVLVIDSVQQAMPD